LRAATLEVRLEELRVLRSFSRPRVSNENPTGNPYSAPLNTGLTIPTSHSAAKKKPANGVLHLWIGTTISNAIAVRQKQFAKCELMFMS
jgi:hypothetical protein